MSRPDLAGEYRALIAEIEAQLRHQSPEEFRRERFGEWPEPEPRPIRPRARIY